MYNLYFSKSTERAVDELLVTPPLGLRCLRYNFGGSHSSSLFIYQRLKTSSKEYHTDDYCAEDYRTEDNK